MNLANHSSDSDVILLAPENFSMVEPGVYRSSFPRTKNIEFLKTLNLKSVVPLVPEEYPQAMAEFYEASNIKLLRNMGLDGNKWPFKEIDLNMFHQVFCAILDPTNRPLLVHCNKGKHRTGSVIGCLRRYRGWSLSSVLHEYVMFAAPKARLEDQHFIESFQVNSVDSSGAASLASPSALPRAEENSSQSARPQVVVSAVS